MPASNGCQGRTRWDRSGPRVAVFACLAVSTGALLRSLQRFKQQSLAYCSWCVVLQVRRACTDSRASCARDRQEQCAVPARPCAARCAVRCALRLPCASRCAAWMCRDYHPRGALRGGTLCTLRRPGY